LLLNAGFQRDGAGRAVGVHGPGLADLVGCDRRAERVRRVRRQIAVEGAAEIALAVERPIPLERLAHPHHRANHVEAMVRAIMRMHLAHPTGRDDRVPISTRHHIVSGERGRRA